VGDFKGQSHSENARITRWIERGPVSDCKWMCVEGGLRVILSLIGSKHFRRVRVRYLWVGVRSLCVEYAWLCAGHVSAVSAYESELVRNRARPRPSSVAHLHITHEPRTYYVYRGTKVLVRGTFAKRACFDALRRLFMLRACVECSWNTTSCLLVCVDVRDISVIRQWL